MESLLKTESYHPNFYSGSGRFSKRSADHAAHLAMALELHGLVRGLDFETGNDAPRGGHAGEFVALTKRGKRKLERMLSK